MTNKINGIDVSECEYINCCSKKAKCIILQDDILSDSQYCESEPNCYFKQLKRLQEENEKLKEDLKGETEQAQKWYQLETDKHFLALKFCKALEEIRERAQSSLNKADSYVILKIINEVLNDRD